MTRPLLVIFLTIFVNLVGFGIIVPLLPFYAERFGASGLTIGLLFGVFSLCQLIAAPVLGEVSDRYGRRPVLIFSLLGTVVSFVMLATAESITMLFLARIVDGLSGGNVSTARAYVADITEPKDRSRAYGIIGAAFGLGFILGPTLSGVLAPISYRAPMWAAAAITALAMLLALFWLPETVHRVKASAGSPLRSLRGVLQRHDLRRVLAMDFIYWLAFAIFQTTVALFAGHRFGFDAAQTGYFFAAFGLLGAVVQGALIGPIVRRVGDKGTFMVGVGCSVLGLLAATTAHSVWMFIVAMVPVGVGIGFGHPTISSLVSRAARQDEQGRVQGVASAVESLGRAIGPVWGNASLQRFGDATPYISAAGILAVTFILSLSHQVSDTDAPGTGRSPIG